MQQENSVQGLSMDNHPCVDNSANNKRIAKNTLLLYLRMLVMMLIGLLTTRYLLKALGVDNLGIYNVLITIVICLLVFIIGEIVKPLYTKYFKDYMEVKNNEK